MTRGMLELIKMKEVGACEKLQAPTPFVEKDLREDTN